MTQRMEPSPIMLSSLANRVPTGKLLVRLS